MNIFTAVWDFFFTSTKTTGGPGEVTENDIKKTLRMAAIMAFGFFLVTLAENFTSIDFGPYKPVVDLGLSGLLELGRRLMTTSK